MNSEERVFVSAVTLLIHSFGKFQSCNKLQRQCRFRYNPNKYTQSLKTLALDITYQLPEQACFWKFMHFLKLHPKALRRHSLKDEWII